eukprot:332058-Hanusia_phi.AAC.2
MLAGVHQQPPRQGVGLRTERASEGRRDSSVPPALLQLHVERLHRSLPLDRAYTAADAADPFLLPRRQRLHKHLRRLELRRLRGRAHASCCVDWIPEQAVKPPLLPHHRPRHLAHAHSCLGPQRLPAPRPVLPRHLHELGCKDYHPPRGGPRVGFKVDGILEGIRGARAGDDVLIHDMVVLEHAKLIDKLIKLPVHSVEDVVQILGSHVGGGGGGGGGGGCGGREADEHDDTHVHRPADHLLAFLVLETRVQRSGDQRTQQPVCLIYQPPQRRLLMELLAGVGDARGADEHGHHGGDCVQKRPCPQVEHADPHRASDHQEHDELKEAEDDGRYGHEVVDEGVGEEHPWHTRSLLAVRRRAVRGGDVDLAAPAPGQDVGEVEREEDGRVARAGAPDLQVHDYTPADFEEEEESEGRGDRNAPGPDARQFLQDTGDVEEEETRTDEAGEEEAERVELAERGGSLAAIIEEEDHGAAPEADHTPKELLLEPGHAVLEILHQELRLGRARIFPFPDISRGTPTALHGRSITNCLLTVILQETGSSCKPSQWLLGHFQSIRRGTDIRHQPSQEQTLKQPVLLG